jgi:dolichol kinase
MTALAVAALFAGFFAGVEIVSRRRGLDRELTRKLVHLVAGLAAAALPLILSFHLVALLGLVFAVAMAASQRLDLLRSIHGVRRSTLGEVCFPLAIAVTALCFPERAIFAYAVATMAVSDVAAWAAGRGLGGARLPLPGSAKTYAGSAAFFAATVMIGAVLLPALGHGLSPTLLLCAPVALLATLVEAVSGRGLDNLLVSPVTGALLWALQIAGALA